MADIGYGFTGGPFNPRVDGTPTASATELNYVDITTLGTGQASKAMTLDANKVFTVAGVPAANGLIYINTTTTSATPGSVRAIVGAAALVASTTSGTIVGTRGSLTLAASASGIYGYGVQGKLITGANTVAGVLAGVYAQFDMTGGTLGAGNIACLQANIYGCNTGTVNLNGVYVESAGGGVINAFLRCFGKSTYVFDFESNIHNQMSSTGTPGSVWCDGLVEGAG